MKLVRPKALRTGDVIGVFTPSSPSYVDNEEMFQNGVKNLEALGFRVKLGSLTRRRASQGYRTASPKERARELMELVLDGEVQGVISTIGGSNSSSLIPYLDFDAIRANPKVICGYSDVTSLHLAILKYAGVRTFYGPAVMTWFGEWPDGIAESTESFLDAVSRHRTGKRVLKPFERCSNHRRSWTTGEWKTVSRNWSRNPGWKVLCGGSAEAPLIAANLNTLLTAAGTSYFPDLGGKILLIESMAADFASEERNLRQLQLMGVFDQVAGLVVGKPEWPDPQGAPFSHDELVMEILAGAGSYPIISEFDCSHTVPMHTIAQMTPVRLEARQDYDASVEILEPMVVPGESPRVDF